MKQSLEDYTRMMRECYGRWTGKSARHKLLDEYCQSTGLERKYANKVLRGQRRRGASAAARGVASRYQAADIAVLKAVWLPPGNPAASASRAQCSHSGCAPGRSTTASSRPSSASASSKSAPPGLTVKCPLSQRWTQATHRQQCPCRHAARSRRALRTLGRNRHRSH